MKVGLVGKVLGHSWSSKIHEAFFKEMGITGSYELIELQAIAGAYGLDAQNMRTKAEVIKLLDDYFAEEDDTEAPPAFGAMDPVE